jgi:poly-beta-1,6-N-acetyl-D-glucosamine biosynthesis protein PgaD
LSAFDPSQVYVVPGKDAPQLTVVKGGNYRVAANEPLTLRDRPPIVEQPGFLITVNRSGIVISSAVLALFATWCMGRVFLFAAWVLGSRALEHHFVALGGLSGVWSSLAGFATGVGFLCAGLFAWAIYNSVRFRKHDRRRRPTPVSDQVVSDHYQLPLPLVWKWQHSRWIRAHHDERGVVSGAESTHATWIRSKDETHIIIKPSTFDILYLTISSRWLRKHRQAGERDIR